MACSPELPPGNISTLFVPSWDHCDAGSRASVVVDHMIWGPQSGLGRLVPGEQVVRVCGLVPAYAAGFSKVTLIAASFLSRTSVLDLGLDDQSSVLCRQPVTSDSILNLVELCAGAGLSVVGFSKAGFVHRCAVEHMPSLAELHSQVRPGISAICADVTEDATASQVFGQCPEPCGIACQPYSRGGSQSGAQDQRASTLPGTLRLLYLLQAPVLIIECVAPAQSNGYVQEHIQALEQHSVV